MPFRGPRNSETSRGPCPRSSQKACASRLAVTPLGMFMAMCLCPPKTNGLVTQVLLTISFQIHHRFIVFQKKERKPEDCYVNFIIIVEGH